MTHLPNFEDIVKNQPSPVLERQYRDMIFDEEKVKKVTRDRGEYCSVIVTGSGNSSWYFYHTMDDSLVFIIELYHGENRVNSYTWQLGIPPIKEEFLPPEPTSLIKTCTKFDCHCVEEGRRGCSVYNLCIKCHRFFNDCECQISLLKL